MTEASPVLKQWRDRDGAVAWASGRDLGLAERSALALRPGPTPPFLRILPVAMDTNELLNQAVWVARRGRPTALLEAVELGVVRIYVAGSVVDEVAEKIALRARKARVDEAVLRAAWVREVYPRLRVVDTAGAADSAVQVVTEIDPDDAPTAVLSLVVGARLTWSRDPDLTETGFAEHYRANIAVAARFAGTFDVSAQFTISFSTEVIAAAARGVRAALSDPQTRPVAVAVLVLVGLALTVFVIREPVRSRELARNVAVESMRALGSGLQMRLEAQKAIPPGPLPSVDEPLARTLAKLLAVSPAPLRVSDIGDALSAYGVAAGAADIVSTLRSLPMFVEGASGWQLGTW